MLHKRVILASSSPFRLAQLKQIGINAQSISPDIDETPTPDESPHDTAARLARAKARWIASTHHSDIVIAGDQTACVHGTLLGKPGSTDNAIKQLLQCSAKLVTFYSGVCVIGGHREFVQVTETKVTFRSLSKTQIQAYVAREQPLQCAGSFKCEGLGIALFESITSDDPSALIGLPLIKTVEMLHRLQYDVLLCPTTAPLERP